MLKLWKLFGCGAGEGATHLELRLLAWARVTRRRLGLLVWARVTGAGQGFNVSG